MKLLLVITSSVGCVAQEKMHIMYLLYISHILRGHIYSSVGPSCKIQWVLSLREWGVGCILLHFFVEEKLVHSMLFPDKHRQLHN